MSFFSSITWRIARWFALSLAVVLVITGVIVYLTAFAALKGLTLNELTAQASSVASRLQGPQGQGDTTSVTDRDLFPPHTDYLFQATTAYGKVLNRLPLSAGIPVGTDPLSLAHKLFFFTLNGEKYAAVSLPVHQYRGPEVAIQVAKAWEQQSLYLSSLVWSLEVVGLLAVILAALLGVTLARSALRPVESITQAVRRMGPQTPGARLPLGPVRDELFRLRQTFNDLISRMEDATRRQAEFVADASHELRTPVTVIDGYVKLLQRWGRADPAVLDEALEAIDRETRHLGRLVADLLAVARFDARGAGVLTRVNLTSIAVEGVQEFQVVFPGLVFEAETEPDVVIEGDPTRIRQLLFILLDNAAKYTGPGGRVSVSVRRQGGGAVLEVADTGIGIPEGDRQRIFERFARVDRARTRSGGSGLGLAIALAIAEAHHATISVESVEGEGSTFRVTWPKG